MRRNRGEQSRARIWALHLQVIVNEPVCLMTSTTSLDGQILSVCVCVRYVYSWIYCIFTASDSSPNRMSVDTSRALIP